MLRRLPAVLVPLALAAGPALTAGPAPAASVAGPIGQADTAIWAGYADTVGKFTSVSANWTQPAGECRPGQQSAVFWVGIDGYHGKTVEQIGSQVDCDQGIPRYYAWWEMYPAQSVPIGGADVVAPGDQFTAKVTYLGGENFRMSIADTTQGWVWDRVKALTTTPALGSAEVIAEAPTDAATGLPDLLTSFGTVSFTEATANNEPMGLDALGPVRLTMATMNPRRVKADCASLSGLDDFTCTWHHAS